MRAVTIGAEGKLSVEQHVDPIPEGGQLLVSVRAAGLNGADMLQRRGFYPPPPGWPADIPGMELAGEVAAVGPGVRSFNVGDRVMAIVGGGAQAELALVEERVAMAVPDPIDWTQAGALPEAFITAHDALFTQAELKAGERVLIHGGAGGVGTAAIQIATAAGAQVYATVRNPEVRDQVALLGAIVLAPDEFVDAGPFDVILELVGAVNLADNLTALAVGGRISVIGVGGGGAMAELNLLALMSKRGRILASTLRARSLEEKALASRALERQVLPAFESGAVTVPILKTYPLEEAEAAYDHFAAGGKLGKIVLLP
jgi:putative PIG3 family NAD(P)H quinone oxidoreductase